LVYFFFIFFHHLKLLLYNCTTNPKQFYPKPKNCENFFLTAGGSIDPSSCQMTTMKHQHQQKTVAKKACAR
jgi:hypothetical protein